MDEETPSPSGIASNNFEKSWTFRDVFRAVPLSFDLQRLAVGAAGLFLSAFVFAFIYWLGLRTGEVGALRVFTAVGLILASCVWVLFAGLLARMTLTQLLEGHRAAGENVRRFLSERWATLIGTPIAFGLLSLFLLGLMALIALVGSVPGLGPIVFSASFILVFLLTFMAILTAVVHALGAFIYPSIVALKETGVIGVLVEMFGLVRRRGFHMIVYEAAVGAVGLVMTVIIGVIVWCGLYLSNWTALALMEDKFEQSLSAIPEFFRIFLRPMERWLPYVPEPMDLPWHYDLSGILLGFSLLWIVVGAAVYPFVFFNTAGSITYLILRSDAEADEPGR